MQISKEVKASCIEADIKCKNIASGYRHSAMLLKKRIEEMKSEIIHLEPKTTYRNGLEIQLKILRQMYRTTSEIGREAKHYYEKGWWRSEVYTLNTR